MAYLFPNQAVITTCLCIQRDADSFFSPVALSHTGFAFDGAFYTAGVKSPTLVASWASEAQGPTRGPLPTFPTQALVIVSRASITILDATTNPLNLWMIFYLADSYGYRNNPAHAQAGYLASAVTWANGKLSITLSPDAGSPSKEILVLTVDFPQDTMYADTCV